MSSASNQSEQPEFQDIIKFWEEIGNALRHLALDRSSDCKILFLQLCYWQHGTPLGLYAASIQSLADELEWSIERFCCALDHLCEADLVRIDQRLHGKHIFR